MATSQYNINSGGFVGQEASKTINAISLIKATIAQTLSATANIFSIVTQTIDSMAAVRAPVILYGSATITKSESDIVYAEAGVANPIPLDPTSLVAVDAGKGDVVNLNWISAATRFNVYKKVGAVYTRLNPVTLEGTTGYSAGGLTTGVAVTFVVRALNGLNQESGDSNLATATPTFDDTISHFSNPVYVVTINGSSRSDAILQNVQLGFGSEFSTATFTLPVDPRGGGQPELDAPVDITINGRLVFRGYITTRGNEIDLGNGLRIAYTCTTNLILLTKITKYSTTVKGYNTTYNIESIDPDNKLHIKNQANADIILNDLGVYNCPSEYPGYVCFTDMTPLSAAELVLSRIGNYRVYQDMPSGTAYAYPFGSNGYNVREFQFTKNIIAYDIQKSNLDIVKTVKLIGSPKRCRVRKFVGDAKTGVDPDGRLGLSFGLSGQNIRDIQVFGWAREKPRVIFDDNIQVGLDDFEFSSKSSIDNSFSMDTFKFDLYNNPSANTFNNSSAGTQMSADSRNQSSNDKKLYPAIKRIKKYDSKRQGMGAKIFYNGGPDNATVYLTEVPKLWYPRQRSGSVKRSALGLIGDDTIFVSILLDYGFAVGTIEVEYTYDEDPPVVTAGSGLPMKSITDSQYGIESDLTIGYDNETDILNRMNVRVNAELARLNKLNIGGTITIVGDETIDLRSSVRAEGQLLQISGILHDFTNGFTTTITLVNEPFFRNLVLLPNFNIPTNKQIEQFSKISIDTYDQCNLAEASKELASQKDKADKQASASGPYANLA